MFSISLPSQFDTDHEVMKHSITRYREDYLSNVKIAYFAFTCLNSTQFTTYHQIFIQWSDWTQLLALLQNSRCSLAHSISFASAKWNNWRVLEKKIAKGLRKKNSKPLRCPKVAFKVTVKCKCSILLIKGSIYQNFTFYCWVSVFSILP